MTTEKAEVFLMTDKEKTKDCQCTYAGCLNICRVNTFYAPSKARCPQHGGKAMIRTSSEDMDFEEIDTPVAESIEVEVHPNHKIRALMCPICDTNEPLEILACTENGHIDFGCQGCHTMVAIRFNWRSAQLRSVPKALQQVVKKFNIRQVGSMDPAVAHQLGGFGDYKLS